MTYYCCLKTFAISLKVIMSYGQTHFFEKKKTLTNKKQYYITFKKLHVSWSQFFIYFTFFTIISLRKDLKNKQMNKTCHHTSSLMSVDSGCLLLP